MIALTYNNTVYKNFLNPVQGKRKQNLTGFFDFMPSMPSISTILGSLKTFSFSQVEQQRQKKKSLIKSTTCFMSWEQCYTRLQLPQQRHNSKIYLVIKMSKQFLENAGVILGGRSFWFLWP